MGARRERVSRQPLLYLVAVGLFMETLDTTIVNTALPTMARALGASPLAMQSVVIAYGLSLAAVIPVSGWVADRFGIRRVYLAAATVFVIGSAACCLSGTLGSLVAARVLQGLGGAMLMPVGRLAVLRAFRGPAYVEALAFVTMPALMGPLLGPPLGGWLVQVASWHWLFLINVPVGLGLVIATWRLMPRTTSPEVAPFDWVGFAYVLGFMLASSLALDGAVDLGLTGAQVGCLAAAALASVVAYIGHARRAPSPLFGLTVFRRQAFALGMMGNLFARLGAGSIPFLLPLFFQLALGETPLGAGVSMLPIAAASILAKSWAGPLIGRLGHRRFLLANTWVLGGSLASFGWVGLNAPPLARLPLLFVLGSANSLQYTAMNTLTLQGVPSAEAGGANSLYSMVQMLAISFSVAIAGALLAALRPLAGSVPEAFVVTFALVGLLTLASSLIFLRLPGPTPRAMAEP